MSEKKVEEVEIPSQIVEQDPALARRLAEAEAAKSRAGLVIGLICILAGLVLILMGFTGDIEWVVKGGGASSDLKNASPGIVLAVAGVIVIGLTRFSYKVTPPAGK